MILSQVSVGYMPIPGHKPGQSVLATLLYVDIELPSFADFFN